MQHELERQIARNEASFREVNEAIAKGRWPGEEDVRVAFRCECGVLGCTQFVELTLGEYERVRSHPRRFVLARDHDIPLAEAVVEEHDGYVVAEKRGDAGNVADATDPRA